MLNHVVSNLSGRVRRERLYGREHLVAPLTLIVPGVLAGSRGPLYYSSEELARDPGAWDGTAITVGHPMSNGDTVSARHPAILNKSGIGFVFGAKYNGRRLTAEGWFDLENTRRIDPRILTALERGEPIELSTGLFTDDEPTAGVYNGREYRSIARNLRPDHLAILPDKVGACSLKDGCGVLMNTNPGGHMDEDDVLLIPTINWGGEQQCNCDDDAVPVNQNAADDDDALAPLPLPTMTW